MDSIEINNLEILLDKLYSLVGEKGNPEEKEAIREALIVVRRAKKGAYQTRNKKEGNIDTITT